MNLWFYKGGWASKSAEEKLSSLDPEKVKSIAVIRHAALGDMVLTRPFMSELRENFPKAKITLSLASNFSRGAPTDLADRVHTICGTDKRDASIIEQFNRTRALGYHDIIFDLAATSRSFWVCALNKAKIKIGLPYREIHRLLLYDLTILRSDFKFEAELLLDMLNMLGIKTQLPLMFNMPGETMRRKRPYVAYFTSASVPQKCWGTERYAELISHMAANHNNYDHIILEGVSEWESVDKLMELLHDVPNVEVIKSDSVEETISFLKGAELLVSNDTGIRNLAISSETKTVGVFFDTTPYRATPFRYWPRYGGHDVVFNMDGSMPSIDAVYKSANRLLAE